MDAAETPQRPGPAGTVACTCQTQPALMPVPEAATLLGRSTEYLYAGLRAGRFPGARFGRAWAIPRAFISGFVSLVEAGQPAEFDEYAHRWRSKATADAS